MNNELPLCRASTGLMTETCFRLGLTQTCIRVQEPTQPREGSPISLDTLLPMAEEIWVLCWQS